MRVQVCLQLEASPRWAHAEPLSALKETSAPPGPQSKRQPDKCGSGTKEAFRDRPGQVKRMNWGVGGSQEGGEPPFLRPHQT